MINCKHSTRIILICFLIGALLSGCGESKPKIDYNGKVDTTSVLDDQIKDTTKILVSELPVKFDSTDVLLFAIGLVDLQERGGYLSKAGSGWHSGSETTFNNSERDYLVGNFINIVFKDKSEQENRLTDKKIRIQSVNFLREVFRKTKHAYLLYTIYDRDTNGDKELNQSDLKALYISNSDGTNFTKITKELHEFYDHNFIKDENRIYFRTLEDKNKDGELNNKDRFHYFYIDFNAETYKVIEHNPLRIFE
jgi:hypothetical protein